MRNKAIRVDDTCRLLVFIHQGLRNIAGVSWDNRVSNNEVRRQILRREGKSADEIVNYHRLK